MILASYRLIFRGLDIGRRKEAEVNDSKHSPNLIGWHIHESNFDLILSLVTFGRTLTVFILHYDSEIWMWVCTYFFSAYM
jgi:hypothetical protein